MFCNNIESDKGKLEIVYDIQWKTLGNDDDEAKIIGIVDTPDTNLDWNTFKSYLIQNSGNMRFTTDDIRISYLDSDDDLIPVDSELEFRECLKFSRIRARRGRKIIMKVSTISNGGAKPKDPKYNEEVLSKHMNPKLFCLKKKDIKDRLKKPIFSLEKPFMNQTNENVANKDEMPEWFEKYMAKFKTELIEELTSAVVSNVQATFGSGLPAVNNLGPTSHLRSRSGIDLPQPSGSNAAGKGHHHHHHHLHHVIEKRKKKKKMPEEDSSDCTDGLQLQWEEKLELLRHMQKINKREKKFEKKLDAKLEKLECKTKKIMEKKHSLWKKNGVSTLSAQNTASASPSVTTVPPPVTSTACDLVMDATPVDEYNYVPRVLRGELVHQIWKVMNDGQLPWTDETELRFAWGSKSLVPLTTVVKCPLLKPGEVGKVKVTLRAPLFPGNFESYWHFHHQGRRFGHWLGCAVIVDPDPRPETPTYDSNQQLKSCGIFDANQVPLPVDLTMKCQQTYQTSYDNKTSTTDDMKIFNIETKPETINKSKPDLVKTEPKIEEQTVQKQSDSKPAVVENVIDTELEEFPRLETYTDLKSEVEGFSEMINLTQPQIAQLLESFSDVSRADDSVTLNRPDINSWAYLPHGASNNIDVTVADLLNIKEEHQESGNGDGGNICAKNVQHAEDGKFEKIVTGVKDLTLEETEKDKDDYQVSGDAGEYSISDSDNISIISGTVSVDSDTEPSDEFVVVPMPTCVNCEISGESQTSKSLPVTQPISVEIPKSSSDSDISAHAVQTSDNNNNMEMKQPYVCIYGAGNYTTASSDNESNEFVLAELKTDSGTEVKEDGKPSDDENTVYVRDSSGKSIPVAKVIFNQKSSTDKPDSPKPTDQPNREPNVGFGMGVNIRHSTFGDPSFGQGPNGPRFPFSCGNDTPTSQPHCHNPGGACNFRPQHESPNCNGGFSVNVSSGSISGSEGCQKRSNSNESFCNHFWQNDKSSSRAWSSQGPYVKYMPPQQPPQCPYRAPTYYPYEMMQQHQEMSGSAASVANSAGASAPTWNSPYHNIHTEQPRPCKFTYVYNNGAKESTLSSNSPGPSSKSSSTSRRSSSENRDKSPVAAAVQILPETLVTGAVNVASSAINTARSVIDMLRPRHDDPVIAQWDQVPPAMENSLRMLGEMGFNNRELNIMLLSQHNNDVARVISELVQ